MEIHQTAGPKRTLVRFRARRMIGIQPARLDRRHAQRLPGDRDRLGFAGHAQCRPQIKLSLLFPQDDQAEGVEGCHQHAGTPAVG